MSNSFMGLNIAKSGLFANQRSLAVVSHNVANANTRGYSRQVLHTQAYSPHMLPGEKGAVGTGVDMNAVKQIRDEYLDRKLRSENSIQNEWEARSSVFREMEGIFNEPSDASIAALMDNYYESLHTLSKNPENLTARALVRQNTIALTEGIQRTNKMLTTLQKDLNFKFQSAVTEVNAIAHQIARTNEAIQKAELEGGKANDLRDRRELLLDDLSDLVDIDYYEDDQNRFFVLIGGHHLVSHHRVSEMKLEVREEKRHPYDAEDLVDVKWANGNPVNMKTGAMKGLLDTRDSRDGADKGIPYYLEQLDEFVDVFVTEMNQIHLLGHGLRDADGKPHTGYAMFTVNGISTADYIAPSSNPHANPHDNQKEAIEKITQDMVNELIDANQLNKTQIKNALGIEISNKDYDDAINKLIVGLNGDPAIDVDVAVTDLIEDILEVLDADYGDPIDPNYDYSDLSKAITFKDKKILKRVDEGEDKFYIVDRITASNIALSKDLDDPNKLAAATNPLDVPGDGSNILKMVGTRHDISLYKEGAPEDFLKALVSNLGVDAAEAFRVAANQAMLVREYNHLRDSVMGVSLDEEMANMIKFQNAYNANARLINVFDEMLDLVVNRLGTVGR